MDAIQMLQKDESYRRYVYMDSRGLPTVGFGRCLSTKGISEDEALMLLQNDIHDAEKELIAYFPTYQALDQLRQLVLTNMVVNMGIGGVMGFRDMLGALEARNYAGAAKAMLDSLWAKEVGLRAHRLAFIMEEGRLPDGYE